MFKKIRLAITYVMEAIIIHLCFFQLDLIDTISEKSLQYDFSFLIAAKLSALGMNNPPVSTLILGLGIGYFLTISLVAFIAKYMDEK